MKLEKITDRFRIFGSGSRKIVWPKTRAKSAFGSSAVFCYKHPEYRLPNTGFFTINITPHRGMGHQESDAPILSISGAFF